MALLITAGGSLVYGLLLALAVGRLARGDEPLRGLSRKVFHVGIFTGAAPAQLFQGFWGVVLYGTVIALIVLLAFLRRPDSSLYRALARRDDEGEAGHFILLPLASTAFGGLLGVLLVGPFAVVGYLVCGWGDALGEPVGRRWGRHHYSTPFGGNGSFTRSVEGSMAVLGAGFLGGWIALILLGHSFFPALAVGLACGAVGAVSEGLSTHGTDNFWVQLLPSLAAWWFLA